MKKILSIVLSAAILAGCSSGGTASSLTNSSAKQNVESKQYSLGDTVETDIARFQLIAAKYSYALENVVDNHYGEPKEYDASTDSRNPYVASKGDTLAAFTFCLEDLDRGELDFSKTNEAFTITYNNNEYSSETQFIAKSNDNIQWEQYDSTNVLLFSGEKEYIRAYMTIDTDVENLDDSMELTVKLPTSEGEEKSFTYSVSAEDRDDYKGEEISEDDAIQNITEDIGEEYFNNHLNDYASMTGEEINSAIEEKKFNAVELESYGHWKGTFKFESSGKIYEGGNKYAEGYTNNRTWQISGDNLILSSTVSNGETETDTYTVKKVRDGVYLLIEDNKIGGILY